MVERRDLRGTTPESWNCVDCNKNTAPGMPTRIEMEDAYAARKDINETITTLTIDSTSEIYTVTSAVWKAAGMEPDGGCLCIKCLEKRLGRKLKPQDFELDNAFNNPGLPCTPLLAKRRAGLEQVRERLGDLLANRSNAKA
jgi:hypothetical protein